MTSLLLRRGITLASACAAFALTTWAIASAIDALGADVGSPSIDQAIELRGKVENLARLRARSDEPIIVLIGDSTVLNDYLRPEVRKDVGRALARRLDDLHPRPRVRTIASPGLSPASAFWMAPDIIAADPAVVVITANLALLSGWWQYAVPELVRWYSPEHEWRPLLLPIHADGLATDGYLVRRIGGSLMSLEAERRFAHARARVRRSRLELERFWLGPRAPEASLVGRRQDRRIHFQGEARYAGALRGVAADHPHLGMLNALVREFEDRGIPVIVYVPPVSPAYFEDGRELDRRFARTLRAIRRAAGPAAFHDLHAALPESAFRDWQDHYTTDGDDSGMDQLAALLEGAVREALAGRD